MHLNKRLTVLASIITVLQYSSCTKILDNELPERNPKLVINGIINPDSILQINISKTFHIFEDESSNNLPFVEGAEAKLFQDGQLLFNLEEDENGYYTKPGFYPSLNHSYKVEVEKSGYNTVYAETTIPAPVAIHSFDTLIVIESDEFYSNTEFKCILKYLDPPGVANYYRLDCYQSYVNEEGQEVKNRQYIYVDEIDDYLFDKSYDFLLWNDLLSDGKEPTIKFNIYFDHYYNDSNNPDTTTITYSIMFNSISENFYTYDKSRNLYYESGGSDNPFSEPVLIYSNVINGYGVFGGYSSDVVSFQYTYNAQNQ